MVELYKVVNRLGSTGGDPRPVNKENKNILFISYYFPPSGGSGVLRIIRFIKNMKHFGWNPSVITVDEKDIQKLGYGTTCKDDSYSDVERISNVKRVKMVRPSSLAIGFIKAIKNAFLSILTLGMRNGHVEIAQGCDSGAKENDEKTRNIRSYYSSDINFVLKFIFEVVLIIDQTLEWAPRAVLRGIQHVKRNNIDVVCSSSPPWSVHLIGCMLKMICRTRWIVDLRDPVFGIETSQFRTKNSPWLIRMHYRLLESLLMRKADVVVCNCEEVKGYYQSKYPKTRFEVIINSFDPDDYIGLEMKKKPTGQWTICHFGELYPTIRTPDDFLRAFASVIETGLPQNELAKIVFYGAAHYTGSKSFEELVKSLSIAQHVESYDYVPHDIVLRKMASADALLLLQPHYSTNYQIPAKLFEYIAVRRPLLAIAPNGSATSRIIREYGLGRVCDPSNKISLKSAVSSALKGELPIPDLDVVEQFSARHMTAKLVDIMNGLS